MGTHTKFPKDKVTSFVQRKVPWQTLDRGICKQKEEEKGRVYLKSTRCSKTPSNPGPAPLSFQT
jgi:hypothetical protein